MILTDIGSNGIDKKHWTKPKIMQIKDEVYSIGEYTNRNKKIELSVGY